jgi:hypothetical protein
MVSYQKWTAVCYETAKDKGASLEGPGTQGNNQALISAISDIWNDRKETLSVATEAEAKRIAEQEIIVHA